MRSVQEMLHLHGRTALITGGAGHIGSTLADALAELGADICILDLSDTACISVADGLRMRHGIHTLGMSMDITDSEQVRTIPDRITSEFGRLDILINNAALVGTSALPGWATPFDNQSLETWRLALETNLTAAFSITQACSRLLTESGNGSIINIASIYALLGPDLRIYEGTTMGSPAAYAVSKSGLLQLTRWLATVLAPKIRVNAISPGGVWRGQPEVFCERYQSRTPLGRMATEEDLKGAVVYLASDLSQYVTGQNLVVDGGRTVW